MFVFILQRSLSYLHSPFLLTPKVLLKILPDYEAHLQAHPVSVLCRICGMHSVRLSSEQRFITIMVQVSVCLAFIKK
jgi:hypothetical protein